MTLQRILGPLACVAVTAGIVLAFVTIGTPGHARVIALDQRRADDIQVTATRLHTRYGQQPQLPGRLPSDLLLRDPSTQQPYPFRRIDTKRYRLCAVFGAASERDSNDVDWKHGPGKTCFTFDVTRMPISPERN